MPSPVPSPVPSIDYDFSRPALYSPGNAHALFRPGIAYSEQQIAIECARLAYIKAEESTVELQRLVESVSLVGFSAPKLLLDAESGTEAFATINDKGVAIIAFRGTQAGDIADIATDLDLRQCDWSESAGRVHVGFAKAARAVLPHIMQWLEKQPMKTRLILTGHSLGAAIATLLASVLQPSLLLTLGSPRVGDVEFATSLSEVAIQRIVNCCDAVIEVPPELSVYTHVGKMLYITRDGEVVNEPDEAAIKADRKIARIDYLKNYAWKKGAVLIRDLADHAPINYARAFF